MPTHLQNRYRIDLLRRREAEISIAGLAQSGGREFAKEAVSHLVTDLAAMNVQRGTGDFGKETGEFVEPLQLQVVCRGLWEKVPVEETRIEERHVEQFGKVTEALSGYYANAVHGIAGGEQDLDAGGPRSFRMGLRLEW